MESFAELGEAMDSMRERLEVLEAWKAATEMYPSLPDVLTGTDIAGFLQMSVPKGYQLMREMRHFGSGKSIRVTRAAFLEWIAAREKGEGA